VSSWTPSSEQPQTNAVLNSILIGVLALFFVIPCHLKANSIGFVYSDRVRTLFPDVSTLDHINDSGDFVGSSYSHGAFVYQAGSFTYFGPGEAYGISNTGKVVGVLANGFSYQNGVLTDLGIPFGNYDSIARAVNDSGAIAGHSESNVNTPAVMQTSWLIDGPTTTNLGTLTAGFYLTNVFAMNNLDQIVGDVQVSPGVNHMYIWSPSNGMVDLGLGSGNALGINNQGDVVGSFETTHGFLYHNGATVDLQQSVLGPAGWLDSGATAINDRGQIVGSGNYPDGQGGYIGAGYLLTPDGLSSSGYDVTLLGQGLHPTSVNNFGVVAGMMQVVVTPELSTLLYVTSALLLGGIFLQSKRRRPHTP
jgi:probable HAF family extracellular repeat protein